MNHLWDIPTNDPHLADADVPRVTGQAARILEMLRERPRTNMELAAITPRYGARIFDIRKAGYRIETVESRDGTGVVWYRIKG